MSCLPRSPSIALLIGIVFIIVCISPVEICPDITGAYNLLSFLLYIVDLFKGLSQ